MSSSLSNIKSKDKPAFLEKDADRNPFKQFSKWYNEVSEEEANVMVLATTDEDGIPSARMVLLKGFSEKGFIFYTNSLSRKGTQISLNPNVALLFYWPSAKRQVRIEGQAVMISVEESDKYFLSRPEGSKISAVISQQSEVIPDRDYLEKKFKKVKTSYQNKEIPRPLIWGGYIVTPEYFEFWQRGENRLHDRLIYFFDLMQSDWKIQRLAP